MSHPTTCDSTGYKAVAHGPLVTGMDGVRRILCATHKRHARLGKSTPKARPLVRQNGGLDMDSATWLRREALKNACTASNCRVCFPVAS
jgi:hypothetical protein